MGAASPVVSENPSRHRFEATLDGKSAGHADYVRSGSVFDFTHTRVGPAFEGRGVASALIRTALDTVRERGEHVLPHCPFVRAYIQQHPGYAELVPRQRRAEFGLNRPANRGRSDVMSSDHDPVHALLVKQEVRDALSRYCRAMDRRDEPLAAALWHPEGTADYGEGIFTGTGAGFAAWVTEVHAGFERTSHQITNVLCEVSGSAAVSEAYVTVALMSPPNEVGVVTQVTSRGRYLDRWSQQGGRWAVDRRQYLEDFTTFTPLQNGELGTTSPVARRDHQDPSYALLSSLI